MIITITDNAVALANVLLTLAITIVLVLPVGILKTATIVLDLQTAVLIVLDLHTALPLIGVVILFVGTIKTGIVNVTIVGFLMKTDLLLGNLVSHSNNMVIAASALAVGFLTTPFSPASQALQTIRVYPLSVHSLTNNRKTYKRA